MNANTRAPRIPGWKHTYTGKVRELYTPAQENHAGNTSTEHTTSAAATGQVLLVLASDRVSAFDHVLEPAIKGKGEVLTKLSRWWFTQLPFNNHMLPDSFAANLPPVPEHLRGQTMLTRKLRMLPIECVVRAALTGSGYAEYAATGSVCGIRLPPGLHDGQLLPKPIFTPAYKAPQGEHDENINFERCREIVGTEYAENLRTASLNIFERAATLAKRAGLLLADTKFEFGLPIDTPLQDPNSSTHQRTHTDARQTETTSAAHATNTHTPTIPQSTNPHGKQYGGLILADEVLTSDSSRYWDLAAYTNETLSPRERLASFDKQIVRNWLHKNWDGTGTPPQLPPDIVANTLHRYEELYTRLTAANPQADTA